MIAVLAVANAVLRPHRTTPVYDPPVLAGQQLWGACAGGFYARRGDTIVLTSTGHCTSEGTVAYDPDGTTVRGVFGPAARDATCAYPGHTCASSDINYLVVAEDRIPWGHLNVVDLGTAGYRVIPPDTRPLGCADIAIGDRVEIDGRNLYREGTVTAKGQNLHPEDGAYFPCMIGSTMRPRQPGRARAGAQRRTAPHVAHRQTPRRGGRRDGGDRGVAVAAASHGPRP